MTRPAGLQDDDEGRIGVIENVLLRRLGDRMRWSPSVRREIAVEILKELDVLKRARRTYRTADGVDYEIK